jgi:hypothetical protein
LAGLLLPKEPFVRFPLAVFLSPLPIVIYFKNKNERYELNKKAPVLIKAPELF